MFLEEGKKILLSISETEYAITTMSIMLAILTRNTIELFHPREFGAFSNRGNKVREINK